MVLTNKVFTTTSYLEAITGNYYCINSNIENDIDFIHEILTEEGYEDYTDNTLWDYPLNEIDEIITNDLNVVLVEVAYFDETDTLIKEFRWFEVPEECIGGFTNEN